MGTQRSLDGSAHRISPPSSLADTRLLSPGFLSREEKQALENAMSSPRSIRPNVDLIREGDRSDSVFVLTEGWAYRYMTTPDGARQLPVLLVPGDVCNLDVLMFSRADYGVRTMTRATFMALPKAPVLALAAKYAGIARTFTWLALVENATLSKWALLLARRPAKERLAHLLCELTVRLRGEQGNTSCIAFPLTQEQIGDALGLTAIHVNRTMQRLRADGLVVITGRVMTLPDVAHLQKICGFDPHYLHAGPVSRHQMTDLYFEHQHEGVLPDRRDGESRASCLSATVL